MTDNQSDFPENEAMDKRLLKPYNPSEVEDRIYAAWETAGFFNPDTCIARGVTAPDAPTFSIVLPPPNVTGTLHMGSAFMLAVEDAMVRFERMRGKRVVADSLRYQSPLDQGFASDT